MVRKRGLFGLAKGELEAKSLTIEQENELYGKKSVTGGNRNPTVSLPNLP